MRRRTIILVAMLSAAIVPLDAAHAQLSPRGILGGLTRPLRQALGHFAHYPRFHRHRDRTASADSRAATATSPIEPSSVAAPRLGFAGAPAWPTAYEDVLGFALWPDDYAARLRGRGFDVIADTISGRGDIPRVSARTATTGAAITDTPNSMNRCSEAASGSQETWPSTRVEEILQLSDAQHDTLEKLQAAVTQSANNIRADCQPAGITPPERLRALVQTLWTVRDAGISVRGPVKGFYDTLTSTQKNSFASNQSQINPPPDPNAGDSGMNRQYQACAAQNAEKAERLIKEIEMRIRPNKDQAASFENFHKTSADMAKLLIMPCAQPIAADPMARLDAASDQLTAMNYAATAVQMAFDDFYGKLNNEQKARFESLAR